MDSIIQMCISDEYYKYSPDENRIGLIVNYHSDIYFFKNGVLLPINTLSLWFSPCIFGCRLGHV